MRTTKVGGISVTKSQPINQATTTRTSIGGLLGMMGEDKGKRIENGATTTIASTKTQVSGSNVTTTMATATTETTLGVKATRDPKVVGGATLKRVVTTFTKEVNNLVRGGITQVIHHKEVLTFYNTDKGVESHPIKGPKLRIGKGSIKNWKPGIRNRRLGSRLLKLNLLNRWCIIPIKGTPLHHPDTW